MRAGSALVSTWTDKPTSTVIPTQYELKRYAKGDCLVVKTSATKTDTWCGLRSAMYGTVDQKIVKFKKSPNTQVKCPQNDQPFEVTAKGVIMHDLYEAEFCEELFGPAPTPAPTVAVAQATPATTTTAPAQPANAGAVTTTTPPRNGVVTKDTTPVTAVQKAYANDLAGISTGQPATLDYENETWYLSRVINGGGARYVGTGGQCIFTVTPDKPAGAPPVVTYTPDKCINMDRLIDNWIRFPKTAAVPLPATTTTTAPRFGINPVINGPEPVTAIPTPVIVTAAPVAIASPTLSRLNPTIRVVVRDSSGYNADVPYTYDPATVSLTLEEHVRRADGSVYTGVLHQFGVSAQQFPPTNPRLVKDVPNPLPMSARYLGAGIYQASIQAHYADGTSSPKVYSAGCTLGQRIVGGLNTVTC
jgi:hypothetical protein